MDDFSKFLRARRPIAVKNPKATAAGKTPLMLEPIVEGFLILKKTKKTRKG